MFENIHHYFAYRRPRLSKTTFLLLAATIVLIGGYWLIIRPLTTGSMGSSRAGSAPNPLSGSAFYIDNNRPVTRLAEQYRVQGNISDANLLNRIAVQPGASWLTGPTQSDTEAAGDIAEVVRTSREAVSQHQVPIYVLYAIPGRDACAGYSKGGFADKQQYADWISRIKIALQTKSVIILEPDAILHALQKDCLSVDQQSSRYQMLHAAIRSLALDRHVLAVYLDAGNAEWMPDPQALVKPLQAAGVMDARGIAVNTASFVSTAVSTNWAQHLLQLLGGDKAAVIDTSRSGKGAAAKQITGMARWCNPPGRGLGHVPTSATSAQSIDAYIWIKKVGESDGECFGNPPAGVFIPAQALELARNASV